MHNASPRAYARVAGVAYLIVIACGLFAEAFVRERLVVSGNAAATAANILANEPMWRLAFAAGVLMLFCNVVTALCYWVLFRPVHRRATMLLLFFLLTANAVEAISLVFHHAPLVLLQSREYLAVFTDAQRQALAYASLVMHSASYNVCLALFGGFDLSIAYLVLRSGLMPRVLGWLMALCGACYISNAFIAFVAPALASALFPWLLLPCFVAELSFALWLALRAVDAARWTQWELGAPAVAATTHQGRM